MEAAIDDLQRIAQEMQGTFVMYEAAQDEGRRLHRDVTTAHNEGIQAIQVEVWSIRE